LQPILTMDSIGPRTEQPWADQIAHKSTQP
jgi:hypothetical protein